MNLFKIIAQQLKRKGACYAFGGTAMMFYGYKDETKDVDLVFEEEKEREEFIKAIESLGFKQFSPMKIYIPKKLRDKNRPLMYKRSEDGNRFDLFVRKIFKTVISPKMKEDLFAVHEFNNFTVKVLRKEHIVMLKAVTEREKDFEDIITITKKEKDFDWNYFVDEVIWQYKQGDTWVLLDAEKMLKELQEYVFIEEKHAKRLRKAVK